MFAVIGGHLATALLAQGADPNLQDDEGCTALMRASRAGQTETVKALLANSEGLVNLDLSIVDKEGYTAADMAYAKGHETLAQHLEQCLNAES